MTLYTDEIKQYAKQADSLPRLPTPDQSLTKSNPVCGDRIIVDLQRNPEGLLKIGMQVRGCLICKVAASLVHQHCDGKDAAHIAAFSHQLEASLNPETSAASLPALQILAPLAEHRHRHNCALLPVRTLLAALES